MSVRRRFSVPLLSLSLTQLICSLPGKKRGCYHSAAFPNPCSPSIIHSLTLKSTHNPCESACTAGSCTRGLGFKDKPTEKALSQLLDASFPPKAPTKSAATLPCECLRGGLKLMPRHTHACLRVCKAGCQSELTEQLLLEV